MRTSISKKLLAGALSVMMVVSLFAGIPANNAQAASKKVQLSATKATLAAGKSKTITIKNVKSSNVKKLTLKTSKKTVATVKKVSNVKFKVTGSKKLTAKKTATITAKVALKKAVNGKKSYTLKFKATVKAKAATKVAVTGVSLSNTTPKVGDVITANITPADATGVTYQWLADNAVIAGATQSTYTVAETDLGKALSVTATDDQGNSVKSAETAKVEAKAAAEIAVTAKQTHAKVVEVTYTTGTPSADNTYKITKGAQTVKASVTTTEGNVVTLTASENLTDGDYKLEVSTTAGKKAEAKFKGEKPVLTDVKFKNNKLAVSANTTKGMVKGYAFIESTDQFGDHMNLTSPTFTVSKGDASFKSDTGILTLDATSTTDGTYKLGEMVVVSVMYDNNTKVVPATLTVSVAAMAKTITFGDLTSDDTKTYPVDKITQTNLSRGVYWFPVTEATDDNDVPLDADRLNQMIEAGTVFVTPKESTGTIIYADQFSEKTVDGKKTIALVVKGGDQLAGLNAGVDMSLSVFSVGGAQATLPVKIARDAVIQNLDIDVPELYIDKESVIKMSATDTDGNKVDLYKVTSNDSLAISGAAVGAGTATIASSSNVELRFWDTAKGSAVIGTKININTGSVNCKWALVRNATDHSVSLKIKPLTGQDEGYLNMTGTTAAYTAITKANIKINATRTIDSVVGFSSAIKTTVLNTNNAAQPLSAGTVLGYNDGSSVGANGNAIYVVNDENLKDVSTTAALTLDKAEGTTNATQLTAAPAAPLYVYSMEIVGKKLENTPSVSTSASADLNYFGNGFKLSGVAATGTAVGTTGSATLTINPTAKTGASDTVKISLYKISKSSDTSKPIKVELLGNKSVTFKVVNEDTAQYVLTFDPDDNVLYAGENNGKNADVLPIYITTSEGAYVAQAKLQSVKIVNNNNDGATFDYDGANGIVCTHKSDAKAGTNNKATIYATVESNGDTVNLEKEMTYVTDQPKVTYAGVYINGAKTVPADGNAVTIPASTTKIGNGSCTIWLEYLDQYCTEASADGIAVDVTVANEKTAANNVTAKYDNETISIYGTGTMAPGETIQFIVNGGMPMTLYCTVGGNVTLTAAPAEKAAVTATAFGTATTAVSNGTCDAPEAGKVYILSDTQFGNWNKSGLLSERSAGSTAGDYTAVSGAISAGSAQAYTATAAATNMKAGTTYYAVYQSDSDSTVYAYARGTSVAASAKAFSTTLTGSNAVTAGTESVPSSLSATDQFGNTYTYAAQSAAAMTAGTGTAADATIEWKASGEMKMTVTLKGTTNVVVGDTFTFALASGETLTAECTTASTEGTVGATTSAKFKFSIA